MVASMLRAQRRDPAKAQAKCAFATNYPLANRQLRSPLILRYRMQRDKPFKRKAYPSGSGRINGWWPRCYAPSGATRLRPRQSALSRPTTRSPTDNCVAPSYCVTGCRGISLLNDFSVPATSNVRRLSADVDDRIPLDFGDRDHVEAGLAGRGGALVWDGLRSDPGNATVALLALSGAMTTRRGYPHCRSNK